MVQQMPARLYLEWMAFYQLEPWGRTAEDVGHAITASTVANANRGKGKKPAKVEDFMPKYEQKKAQSVDEQKSFAQMFAGAGFGKITTRSEDD